MSCPVCDSRFFVVLYKHKNGMDVVRCKDCQSSYYDSVEYYENEPDLSIIGGGSVTLRRFFCLRHDITLLSKLSFFVDKRGAGLKFDKENGLSIIKMQSGGLGVERNTNLINTIRHFGGIKPKESAFFKLRETLNGFLMEQINYQNFAKRRRLKQKSKELPKNVFVSINQNRAVRFSSGAAILMDLESAASINIYRQEECFYMAASENTDGFPINRNYNDYYGNSEMADFLSEFLNLPDSKIAQRVYLKEVKNSENNEPIFLLLKSV